MEHASRRRARPSALKEVLGGSWQNRLCSTEELIILSMSQSVWWGLSPALACLDQSFFCSFTCGAFSWVWLYLFWLYHPGHNTVQNLMALKRTNERVGKNKINVSETPTLGALCSLDKQVLPSFWKKVESNEHRCSTVLTSQEETGSCWEICIVKKFAPEMGKTYQKTMNYQP